MKKKIDIIILSGFLGSGKTTLLTNLLQQEKQLNRKVAVIMNELGKISIDSQAVPDNTPLKELLNGCVCCTMQGQLEAQLQELLLTQNIDVIYIETTGVAHPIEVVDACMSPIFADKLTIQGIITIVDSKRWFDRDKLSPQMQQLLYEQIRHADTLLLNKTDHLTDAEQANLIFSIQAYNTHATCLLTTFANISLQQIQAVPKNNRISKQTTHVQHDLKVKSYVYQFMQPLDIDAFENWLREMPETILRIKGYLKFTHSESMFLFQYSYGMPIYMKEPVQMPMNLVFIGENLNTSWLENEMIKLEQKNL
ncbi:GTP-binding protein [Cytobacillus sp. IB215316]|uniref:CobW family GTP-binding protein n=1 Tax=Cytobacillus sp. IB215316 TaxID=3097354 RepID=UPI002A147C55|nr:GTP-binding protein [Cytobacillus sp. IB215316]MDX8360329.1 GTP-binding protein [Cytobacillus sp. IB215316]